MPRSWAHRARARTGLLRDPLHSPVGKWEIVFGECRAFVLRWHCSLSLVVGIHVHLVDGRRSVDRCIAHVGRLCSKCGGCFDHSKCFAYNAIARSTQSLCMSHLAHGRSLFVCVCVCRCRWAIAVTIWMATQRMATISTNGPFQRNHIQISEQKKCEFRKCQDSNDCIHPPCEVSSFRFNYFHLTSIVSIGDSMRTHTMHSENQLDSS